jgi:hypothetical protein
MHVDHERWQFISPNSPAERSPRLLERIERRLVPPSRFRAALIDAMAWIVGAIALRISVNLLLASAAHLWFPGIVVLSFPVIVAVCLVNIAPELGWLLGYRLILVLFGLLLGGRLWP